MRKLLLALIPMLVIACDQSPVAPTAQQGTLTPSFDWMNNPDVGNFKIYRFEDGMAACWTDPENGLRACHSTNPLGGGSEPDCGLQSPGDPGAWQVVVVDEEADRVLKKAHGRVWVTIRNTGAAGECFDQALVAEGWGEMRYTDNDANGAGAHNANAWGFMASGALLTPDAVSIRYAGHARDRWNYSQEYKGVSTRVNVH